MAFKEGKPFSEEETNFTNHMGKFVNQEGCFYPLDKKKPVVEKVDVDSKNQTKAIELREKNRAIPQEQAEEQSHDTNGDLRFTSSETERISNNQENINKTLDKNKENSRREDKAKKKQSTKLSVSNMFRSKAVISNELGGEDENRGDSIQNRKSGFGGALFEVVNPKHYMKALMAKLALVVGPYVVLFMTISIVVVILVVILFDILQPLAEVRGAITGVLSMFTSEEATFVTVELSEEEISQIITDAGGDETQEKVLRYALSKVGYPYSQDYRCSGNYYDCSSLAYYAWEAAGIDISSGSKYPPTAAEGARTLKEKGQYLSIDEDDVFSLKPGDLVYYGGSDNGRYMGIYHVAIYVGNGEVVEALNEKYGVVYKDIDVDHTIMVCRPE